MDFFISTHFLRPCRNGLKARPWFLLGQQQRGFIGCPQSSPKPHWPPEGCGGQTSLSTLQKQHNALLLHLHPGDPSSSHWSWDCSSLELLLPGNNQNILIIQPLSKGFVLKWDGDFMSFRFICSLFCSLNCAVAPVMTDWRCLELVSQF